MKRVQTFSVLALTGLLLSACGSGDLVDAKPNLTLTADRTTVSGAGTVKLTANTSDTDIKTVVFYRGTSTTPVCEDAAAPFECTVSVTEADAGTVTYRAVATDQAGQTGEASVTVTVEGNAAPTVTLQVPQTQIVAAGPLTVTATATDADGIEKVEFYLNGQPIATDTSAPYTATISLTFVQNGRHVITAKAYDTTGQVSEASQIITVGIDRGESNNTLANATQINIGENAIGRITGVARDFDYYKFTGTAGDRLKVTVRAQSFDSTSTLDPYVQILMPDGKTILEEDDDGGAGKESEVRFDLPVSGTYYIMVTDDRIHEDDDYTNSDFTNVYRLDLTRR